MFYIVKSIYPYPTAGSVIILRISAIKKQPLKGPPVYHHSSIKKYTFQNFRLIGVSIAITRINPAVATKPVAVPAKIPVV